MGGEQAGEVASALVIESLRRELAANKDIVSGETVTKMLDIADTVATNRILTKMAAVLQSSELITFLSSRGPFTLFAPTDAAFSKLPPDTLAALLRPENKERLQGILLFHVVNGKSLTAKDLAPLTSLLSCEGNPLAIKKTKSGVQMVLKAKIVHADIRCLNGIINEIDTVLMPPESALPPLAPPRPPAPPAPPPGTTPVPGGTTGFKPDLPADATVAPVPAPRANTNAAPVPVPPVETNATPVPAPPADTNSAPVNPVAPVATPETTTP